MEQILTFDTRAIANLQTVMRRFMEVARHSWERVLAHEVKEWRYELWKAFKKISPTPQQIISAAIDRKFRVKRSGNQITPSVGGISAAAAAAADLQMGGNKSELFRVNMNANGVFITPIRFSAKRIKVLQGGRSGRRFSDSARRASEVQDVETLAETVHDDPSIKVLNRRAVGVAIELGLRSRAAKGGTMGFQWLGTNYQRRDSSTVKRGIQVVRSTKGIPLGIVDFRGEGDDMRAELSALVPGTAKQAEKHGIVGKIIAIRIADRNKFILDRIEEAKQKALSA